MFFICRCAETEDDNDFNVWGLVNALVPTGAEVPVQTLPHGISEQQLGLEAFNYVDRGSESKFRGELVSYDIGRILVSLYIFVRVMFLPVLIWECLYYRCMICYVYIEPFNN